MNTMKLMSTLCLLLMAYTMTTAQVVNKTKVDINSNKIEVKDTTVVLPDTADTPDGTSISIGKGGIRIFSEGDSVEVNFGARDTPKDVTTRWVLMDIGTDGISRSYDLPADRLDPLEMNAWKSTNVNLHVFQQRINLSKHKLHLKWGLTFQFHKYYLTNPFELLEDEPQVSFARIQENGLDKNRLSYSYLTMPLMLNYRLKPKGWKRPLNVSAGGYAGPRLGANFKIKDDDGKNKTRDDFNLSKWRYGLRGELGLGFINFYGMVALNDLFQEDRNGGFEATPFSIGVSVIPF